MPAQPSPNILLIGLRGSGKSTLGALLAQRLRRSFVDLDDRTPAELGEPTVADAFGRHGEPAFRAAEMRALKAALAAPDQVIALGGGTPTAPGAPEILRTERDAGRALLIYLRADAPTLRSRLSTAPNAHRPSLTGRPMLDEIDDLLARRDPLYRSLADHTLEVSGLSTDQALASLGSLCSPSRPGPPA